MNKDEKRVEVARLKDSFNKHNFAYVIGYKGVEADVLFRLRYAIKQHGSVKFVKNSLAKIAAKETNYKELADSFKEVCILVMSNDASASVKCVLPFLRDHDKKISLKSGVLEGEFLNSKDLVSLGNMPSREQLLAEIVWLLQYPMRRLHHMIKQLSEKKGE